LTSVTITLDDEAASPSLREPRARQLAAWAGLEGAAAERFVSRYLLSWLYQEAREAREDQARIEEAARDLDAARRERIAATRFALAGRYPEPEQGREAA